MISEQVGLVLLNRVLVSVEEVPRPVAFPELTHWLEQLQPPPGAADLDDILFFLVDEVLDEVLPLLEDMAEQLDELEDMPCGAQARRCCGGPTKCARACGRCAA